MAEKAPTSVRFWQAWALAGAIASALAGARHLSSPQPTAAPPPVAPISAKVQSAPRLEVELAPTAPIGDRLLARLAAARTGAEECELLQRLPRVEDPATTYAITDVLERTRFRSVRACATEALSREPTPPAQSWLIDLADDPDPEVQRSALEALAAHGDNSALAVVIEAAHSDDLDIRASAVIALLDARHGEAFSAAVELLSSADQRETLTALVDALGKSQDPRALTVLATLIAHADTETHLHAISALGELKQKKAEPLLAALLEVGSDQEYRAAAKALTQLSPESAVATLQSALRSANGVRREAAMYALASSKLPGVAPILADALRGDDLPLARDALRQLTLEPDASLEPEITALLDRDDHQLQPSAIHALSRLGTASALATLARLADSDAAGEWVRNELDRLPGTPEEVRARHIQNLAHGAVRPLDALARDPSEPAQSAVLGYFSKDDSSIRQLQNVVAIAPESTVQQLVERADSSPEQKQALINGLAERGDPTFAQVLRAATHDENDEIRRSAMRGLVGLGDDESSELLQTAARSADASERGFAAELLGARPGADGLPLLETLATDPDAGVASAALGQLQASAPELAATLAKRAYQAASAADRPMLLSSLSGLRGGLAMPLYDLALQDTDENVVLSGVQSLGQLQGPDSAGRLLAVVSDTNRSEEVRRSAAQALLALGGPLVRANRTLLETLEPADATGGYTCNAPSQ